MYGFKKTDFKTELFLSKIIMKVVILRYHSKMIKMKKYFLLSPFIFLFFLSLKTNAQISLKDSSAFTTLITVNYSFQFPGGDLKERYGDNSTVGSSLLFKTRNKWIFGADFNYIFGNDVKLYNQILKNLMTSDGNIISREGIYGDVKMFERGFFTSVKFGKMFNVFNSNPNSGIVLLGSVGILQHSIRIEVDNNSIPQLMGDYAKGYDRLSNGWAISQFVGYMYLSDRRLTNFFAGFEFTQGWTKTLRDYNFDTMSVDKSQKFDTFWGFKIGWIFPIYQRAPEKYYYN